MIALFEGLNDKINAGHAGRRAFMLVLRHGLRLSVANSNREKPYHKTTRGRRAVREAQRLLEPLPVLPPQRRTKKQKRGHKPKHVCHCGGRRFQTYKKGESVRCRRCGHTRVSR